MPAGAAILAVGASIAAMAGFDAAFNLATQNQPLHRIVGFLVIASTGWLCARRADLHLLPRSNHIAVAIAAAVAVAMAAGIALVDALLFRSHVAPEYVALIQGLTPADRILYFSMRAFNEEVFYRLFLTSAIAWVLGHWLRNEAGMIPSGAYWIAIVSAQTLAILVNVILPHPLADVTPTFALYTLIRFVAPGIVWGYLYWRHGLVTAQLAHIGTHLFLQPILGGLC